MKKKIFASLLALIMVVTLVGSAVPAWAARDDEVTIRIHYHRPDGDYEGWQLWSWDYDGMGDIKGTAPDGSPTNGAPFGYEKGNGEVIFTIRVKTGAMRIGYIIRYGEWEKKDVEQDQYINITGILSGTVDFYVESGVPTQTGGIDTLPSVDEQVQQGTMVLGTDVTRGVMIVGTSYKVKNRDGKPEISLEMSGDLGYSPDLSSFKVSNVDGDVPLESVRSAGKRYYLVLATPLDLSRNYFVTFEGSQYAVDMPDYYSNEGFETEFTYTGDDLGMTYSKASTALRVWAPTAIGVKVKLYKNGDVIAEPNAYETVAMSKDVNGTWVATLSGDMNGVYYTYEVTTDVETVEACDPYARAVGINGDRAMIIDLDATDPAGWGADSCPHAGKGYTDAVIYELHVRDASMDGSSGITNKGKYLGLIEKGTKTPGGISTGLDHMVDLGITHVHLLPVYDINSVDERKDGQYNWGYDPKNYNVPEGSYSTDPYHGEVRVKEFKQMVKGMHDAGIGVIMDVVYNHVADANRFCFDQIVDGYFTRPHSNGSGCGNDVATERSMVSKYIVDSVNYWADEYHIDGFRFDLAGLIDIDTINKVVQTVHAKHPDVIFYGEGWTMSTVWTKSGTMGTTQTNAQKVPDFAFFSDNIRNEVKGGTYGGISKGFISGGNASTGTLFACFKGMPNWCPTPSQSVNYLSCHDNDTLYDHICMAALDATDAQRMAMNRLGAAFYLTAQGIPFFQAGEEFLRSKPDGMGGFDDNSYNSGDAVNALKWRDLEDEDYRDVYEYYKGLIAFRKAHPALRMSNAHDVESNVQQASLGLDDSVVAYRIQGQAAGDSAEEIYVVFNADRNSKQVTLPKGLWDIYVDGDRAGTDVLGTASGTVTVEGLSALVVTSHQDKPVEPPVELPIKPGETKPVTPTDPQETTDPQGTTGPQETAGDGQEDTTKDQDKTEGGKKAPGLVQLLIVAGISVAVLAVAVVLVVLILKKR